MQTRTRPELDRPPRATMKAIVQDGYGPPDVLRPGEIDVPQIGANEVLVQVRAAGLDRGAWHLMTGQPYLMRLMGFGVRRPKNPVLGMEVAGIVVTVGAEVTRFAPGDEVFGIARGSFAQYAAAREDKLARKPANLTFEQAAVVPISGLTAIQALHEAGPVKAGHKVLVIGASGGVGSYALQLAKARGAHVTGVCSTAKIDLVQALGADHIIDYTRQDFLHGTTRYDVIVDTGGRNRLPKLRRALAPTGTLVIVGGDGGGKVTGGFGRGLRAALLSPLVRQRLVMLVNTEHHRYLDELRTLIEAGTVTPALGTTYPLEETSEAMRRLEAGQARGKIAITI